MISHRLGWETDFPGVALPSEQRFWKEISPNPYRLLGIPEAILDRTRKPTEEFIGKTPPHRGTQISLSYKEPLTILRGEGAYLIDALGRRFVDCVNNVAHVGHCHPKVVEAQKKTKWPTQHKYPLPSPRTRQVCRALVWLVSGATKRLFLGLYWQ